MPFWSAREVKPLLIGGGADLIVLGMSGDQGTTAGMAPAVAGDR
jgi:hypothetical protein